MTHVARGILLAGAIALAAACNRPNLRSTGGGYAPDTAAAPLTGPAAGPTGTPAATAIPDTDYPPAVPDTAPGGGAGDTAAGGERGAP